MNAISREQFNKRQSELTAEKSQAEAARDAAELKAALGEITDEELQKARAAVADAEGKLRGWAAAFNESNRLAAAQSDEEALAKRREDAQTARAAIDRRAKAFRAIAKGIEALAPRVREYSEATETIIAATRDHRNCLSGDTRLAGEMLSNFFGSVRELRRERDLLQATLYQAGFGVFQMGAADAYARARDLSVTTDSLMSLRSDELLGFVDLIDPSSAAAD
jgi:chromosome segregation ATPase